MGSARPNPKKGAPDTENPSCIRFTVLRGGLRLWSQTMVSEGARPWGRGRSEFAKTYRDVNCSGASSKDADLDLQHGFESQAVPQNTRSTGTNREGKKRQHAIAQHELG